MLKQGFSILLILIFISYNSLLAQEIRPSIFATFSGFRHTEFKDNLFTDFELGLAMSSKLWITPQISYKNSGGDLAEQIIFREDITPLQTEEEVRVAYSANLFSVGARFRLTKQEDFWLFFWPRYYGGTVRFRAEYLALNDREDLVYKEIVREKEFTSYFDFSVGFSGYIDDTERLSASAFITYTTMDLDNGFKTLEFEKTDRRPGSTGTNALGIGFMVEYVLW